jgi:hypothetical protein
MDLVYIMSMKQERGNGKMAKDERERIISVLENGAQVRVEDDGSDTLRLSRRISRTKVKDLGIVVITDDGLDLGGLLQDAATEWYLRHQADMGKKPLTILGG